MDRVLAIYDPDSFLCRQQLSVDSSVFFLYAYRRRRHTYRVFQLIPFLAVDGHTTSHVDAAVLVLIVPLLQFVCIFLRPTLFVHLVVKNLH